MDELVIGRSDIDALAQAVDGGTLPAADLLRAIVTAIQSAAGQDEVINVSVEVESVPEIFDAAFLAEPAPEAPPIGGHVRVTFGKIGR